MHMPLWARIAIAVFIILVVAVLIFLFWTPLEQGSETQPPAQQENQR
jgi:hypothetical protein